MTISTDNVELAADIVQSLAGELQLADCNSQADFPLECQALAVTLDKVWCAEPLFYYYFLVYILCAQKLSFALRSEGGDNSRSFCCTNF